MQWNSWFSDSAELYSPIIMIRLICSTFLLACTIFQLDLVSEFESYLPLNLEHFNSWILIYRFDVASKRCQFRSGVPSSCDMRCADRSLFVLLFWKIGGWKLRKNRWLFLRMQLAQATKPTTPISYHYDCKCSTTTLLHRIQIGRFEFGHILQGK